MSEEKRTIENIQEAFDKEFERFSNLGLEGLSLSDAEASLREIGELKVVHTGKKSAIAEAKKLIQQNVTVLGNESGPIREIVGRI